jgi:hypothetical protein
MHSTEYPSSDDQVSAILWWNALKTITHIALVLLIPWVIYKSLMLWAFALMHCSVIR